ncbi:MAG: ABC transporter transmembrane domain-containing protein [Pseudomonadota bacterium]
MEPRLFRYIWKHTKTQQLFILLMVLCSIPIYFVVLELPKRIVNGPIMGEAFPETDSTQRYFELTFGWPFVGDGNPPITLFEGVDLTRMEALLFLSFGFLAFVMINGLLKYIINTYKGILGERMLRRLRYELMDTLLRFPIRRVRKARGSEIASMVKDEVEPLGGFIGDSFALPIFQLAQALTALAFIMMQSFYLGLIAVGMIAITTAVIPPLRRRLITLARMRQLTARALAGRVGEIVDGIEDIRVNDTSFFERSDLIRRLGEIFYIRFDIYRWKFFVKFLNNFLAQMTPFLFYMIGGFFVIMGSLDIGQLVAVIAAYRDLPPPVKEIINWDQRRLDVQSKYTQVVEQFASDDEPINFELQAVAAECPPPLQGKIAANYMTIMTESGQKLIDGLSVSFDLNDRVAVLGNSSSGKDVFVEALVGIHAIDHGSLVVGTHNIETMPDAVKGRRMAYVSDDPYFKRGTIEETIAYGLRSSIMGDTVSRSDTISDADKKRYFRETQLTGQPYFDPDGDWTDYESAGVADMVELDAIILDCLDAVGLSQDVYEFALYSRLDRDDTELITSMMQMRRAFRLMVRDENLRGLIEYFRPDHYHNQSTIFQNIVFGSIVKPENFDGDLQNDPDFLAILAMNGCDKVLFELGVEVSNILVGLLGGVETNLNLLHRLGLMDEAELAHYAELLKVPADIKWETASDEAKRDFLIPAMRYREPRHRFGVLEPETRRLIVEARKNLRLRSSERVREAIQFYNPNRYNHSENIGANLIFGYLNSQKADVENTIRDLIYKLLSDNNLVHKLMKVGLKKQVGNGGQDLSDTQRQKLNLARALVKKPDIIVVNNALSHLDRDSFSKLFNRILDRHDGGLVWALSRSDISKYFERVLKFDNGRLIENEAMASPGDQTPQRERTGADV